MIVRTETGTEYEFSGSRVRRIPAQDDNECRRDGEWLDIVGDMPVIKVGMPISMYLEPLGVGILTWRITSSVTEVVE